MKPIYWLAVIIGIAFSIWYVFGRDKKQAAIDSIINPSTDNLGSN